MWFNGPSRVSVFNFQTKPASNWSLLDNVDAMDEDNEEFVRRLITKKGPRCFFCNLQGQFKSDCTQFWNAVADGSTLATTVEASRARLMNEA